MNQFTCDQCGACCRGTLIVEADDLDYLREPKLAQADPYYTSLKPQEVLDKLTAEFGTALIIACGQDRPCPFLSADATCSIYPTRPNACVGMQAGDEQCQQARLELGLEKLQSQ
jgi:Fe-S-cluster containining protein